MKLSRLLLLVPAAGLLMTGCDEKKTLSSISVSGSYQTIYAVGEALNKSGVVVTATYSDGSTADVTSSATFGEFSSAEVGAVSVSVSYEGKSAALSLSVLGGYTFEGMEAAYASYGVEVSVPGYLSAEGAGEVNPYNPAVFWISGTTAEELAANVVRWGFAGWSLEAYSETEQAIDPETYEPMVDPETGEPVMVTYTGYYGSCGRALVTIGNFLADEEDPCVQFYFGLEPVHYDAFAEAAVAFYAENGVEGVVVPEYALASEEAYFDIDDTWADYGSIDVYAYGSSHEEMEAYKDLLVENGWVVVGEEEGDYMLQYGENDAVLVYLLDYLADEDDPCIDISFCYYPSEE